MRAFEMGSVNDERTTILLDAGDNIPLNSESFAQKLMLKDTRRTDKQIDVQ